MALRQKFPAKAREPFPNMPNTIQPGEYSMGSGEEDILYTTATPTATCMSGICTGTMVRGTGTTTGWTTTSTATILRRCSQLSQVLSSLSGRVLFLKLTVPTTDHLAN